MDKVKGCLYGVCVGDALGVRYEFLSSDQSTSQIKKDKKRKTLHILGGGPFMLETGQISDDSELTLSLANGIIEYGTYNQEVVARKYINWYLSDPCDCGNTIRSAVMYSKNNKDMIRNSLKYNRQSLSNGALMRIAPLGIYCRNMDFENIYRCVKKDCELTHPNPIVWDACSIYVYAIALSVNNNNKEFIFSKCISESKIPEISDILKRSAYESEPVIQNGMKIFTDDKRFMGFLFVALQNTFYEFLNGTSFSKSMEDICKRGGDTDTNCAIAGGLLGSYYGYHNIPNNWLKTIKKSKYDRNKKYEKYSVSGILSMCRKLYKISEIHI